MRLGLSVACLVVIVVVCGVGWVGVVVCGANVGDGEKGLIGRSWLYLIWLRHMGVHIGSDIGNAGFVKGFVV